jgi:hypothetical protein
MKITRNDNKMLSQEIKNLKSSFLRTVLLVAIAITIVGVMSPTEVMAQAMWARGKFIHIGLDDRNSLLPYENYYLTFGNGDLYNQTNSNLGMWGIGVHGEGLNINRIHSGMVSNPSNGIFYIDSNWNVGIGVSWSMNPQYRLDIRGGEARVDGAIVQTSDKRYKKDIAPLTEDFDKLSKLNSIKYKRSSEVLKAKYDELKKLTYAENDATKKKAYEGDLLSAKKQISDAEKDTVTHFGFIAQELREIYPNLVFEDNEGYLSVNYIGLIPVLVEAIKEQQQQINELKGKGFEKTNATVVSDAKLYQNNPNPFTDNTEIKFYIPENSSSAMICIYDLNGSQIMRFDLRDKGYSSLTVRGRELKAGMYIYALLVDGKEIDTKRMILTDK